MAAFQYIAASAGNERRDGLIEAATVQDAAAALHEQGLYVIRIGRPSRASAFWRVLNQDITLRNPIGPNELARLSQEWAGLVEAGISIEESLALLSRTGRSGVRQVLAGIREAVKAGVPLHEALERFPAIFPPVYRALIQAGDAAGRLAPTLRRLGDDLAARRAVAEEVRNALLYPAFLLVTATGGILVLLLVVVPNLEALIGMDGRERLPAMTRLVLAVSQGLRDHGPAALGLLSLFAVLAMALLVTPEGRRRRDAIILVLPFWGPLVTTIETGRFARVFGGLLSGGVPVPVAMRLALDTIANRRMTFALEPAHQAVVAGSAIGEAIAAGNILSDDAIGLVRVGERTGRLAEALERAAALLEGRATRQLKAFTVMLAPLMTIGFGMIAGVIVYAMLSTILGINELAAP